MKIAIMAGHQGKDSGAIDPADPAAGDFHMTIEAVVTATIASKVVFLCGFVGIDTVLATGTLADRCKLAIPCGAAVEIHADTSSNTARSGFHAIYSPGSSQGRALALNLDHELALILPRCRQPHEDDRGLYVMKHTACPCVILECGFLTNISDEKTLNSDAMLSGIAFQIVVGLREWLLRR
jgi:N-acetylmuramoyl-L-alanine amidase